jgi:hypothetical protein
MNGAPDANNLKQSFDNIGIRQGDLFGPLDLPCAPDCLLDSSFYVPLNFMMTVHACLQ